MGNNPSLIHDGKNVTCCWKCNTYSSSNTSTGVTINPVNADHKIMLLKDSRVKSGLANPFLNFKNGNQTVLVDATFKTGKHDNFKRDWPNVVTMDKKTILAIDKKWNELGLGEFIQSPSLKFLPLIKGEGAIRD